MIPITTNIDRMARRLLEEYGEGFFTLADLLMRLNDDQTEHWYSYAEVLYVLSHHYDGVATRWLSDRKIHWRVL